MQKKESYSLNYNQKRKVWIAQVRKVAGGWLTKYLPKTIQEHDEVGAEAYLQSWLPSYLQTGETKHQVRAERTLLLLAPLWLAFRDRDGRTSPNTLRGFRTSLRTWILDSSFQHQSIQDVPVSQLSVSLLLKWIDSLTQSPSSKLSQISCLRSLLNDSIALEWIDREMDNPLNKPAIQQREKQLKAQLEEARVNTYLTLPQLQLLLTHPNTYLNDYKRMRYLLAATTGLRDSELQGLQWKDLDLSLGTIRVNKQLYKRGSGVGLDYFSAREELSASQLEAGKEAVVKSPKKGSKRILPLPSLTLEALRYWKKVSWQLYTKLLPTEESPVFPRSYVSLRPGEKAGQFCSSDSSSTFQKDLERCNLPVDFEDAMGGKGKLTFHSLRHTFSHLLDSVGADGELIGVLLGHSSKTVARTIYIPANIEKWREVVDRIGLTSVVFKHREIGKRPELKLVRGQQSA